MDNTDGEVQIRLCAVDTKNAKRGLATLFVLPCIISLAILGIVTASTTPSYVCTSNNACIFDLCPNKCVDLGQVACEALPEDCSWDIFDD